MLVELLRDVLGDEKQHYESKGQISFDCPVCAREKGLDKGDTKKNYSAIMQLFTNALMENSFSFDDLTNMKSMKGSEKLFEIKSAKGVDNALCKNTKE